MTNKDLEMQLMDLFAKLPSEQRSKLPDTTPFFGQIRTNGSYHGGQGKFMFQWHQVEGQFYAPKHFSEIVEKMAVVGRKKVRSWHSQQPYTPVMFWPDTNDGSHILIALWFTHTDGTVRIRAYNLYMTAAIGQIADYVKAGKTNGINPKMVERIPTPTDDDNDEDDD